MHIKDFFLKLFLLIFFAQVFILSTFKLTVYLMTLNFIYIFARFYSERGHTKFLCVTNLLSANLLNPACNFYQCIYEPNTNQSCGIIFHFLATVTVSRVFRATKREPGNTENAEKPAFIYSLKVYKTLEIIFQMLRLVEFSYLFTVREHVFSSIEERE